jgi:hypothetical protein
VIFVVTSYKHEVINPDPVGIHKHNIKMNRMLELFEEMREKVGGGQPRGNAGLSEKVDTIKEKL